ncbi:uncharacterized protein LOC144629317 isoform X2 [Oculina patagonica]
MILQRYPQAVFLAYIVAFNLCMDVVWSCDCDVAKLHELGIEDGHIPDAAITASSTLDANHGPGRGRLNQGPTGSQGTAWCAAESNSDQYLQIDLIYTSRVTHIATQGMNDPPEVVNGSAVTSWVKEYTLEYSSDGETYNGYYFDKDLKVFDGNKDGGSISCCDLPYPLVIRYIRFKPVSWDTKICLRVGVFGTGNVTANTIITENQIAVRHYWWWPFMWVLIILLIFLILLALCFYRRIRKRLALKPRPSKTEKKQPSFYTNPRAPKSPAQNGTMTVVMTDIMETHENENYEEAEDEVQEAVAHFTHFSVADEDEDELPASFPDQNHNGPTRGASVSFQNQPYNGAPVGSQDRRNTTRSAHLYESAAVDGR